MIDVPLAATANQSFTMRLDNSRYEFVLKEANGVMAMTITRDGVEVLTNARCVPGAPQIPYRYLESGNFLWLTENDEYPYWDQFGVTQSLVYLTAAELAVLRG